MRFSELPLPRWRCVPVHVALPDRERLEPVIAAVPERIEPEDASGLPAFLYACDLFNAGYFWEAHEVWEPVWSALPPNGRERTACRALIQGANAFFQLATGNPKGFGRLAGEVERLAGEARFGDGPLLGLALEDWAGDMQVIAARVRGDPQVSFGFDTSAIEGFPRLKAAAV